MSLPEGYIKGVPRVSDIVEYIYPFEGTKDEEIYLKRLEKNNIEPEEYLKIAQDWGTIIHNSLEDYINKKESLIIQDASSIYTQNEIKFGKEWIDNLDYSFIETEKYIREKDNLYQGSVDLLYISEGKIIVADWKTYGIAKKNWGLNKSNGKIPPIAKKKKDKVQLQMSLYARALMQQGKIVDKIELLYLNENGIKVVELDILPNEKIEEFISSYYKSLVKTEEDINLFFKGSNMIIEIQSPTGLQYEYVNIRTDTSKLDSGKTPEEELDNMIKVRNSLRKKLNDNR